MRVAVNISPSQFLRQDVFALVNQSLDDTGLPSALLELELTEGTLLDDRPPTADALRALSARGVQFSIDDFGTGYASLSYFKRVSVSRIKIDQSYIRHFPASREDAAIVGSAVASAGRSAFRCWQKAWKRRRNFQLSARPDATKRRVSILASR